MIGVSLQPLSLGFAQGDGSTLKNGKFCWFYSGSCQKGRGFPLDFCAQTSASWDLSQSAVQASIKKDGTSALPDTQCETDRAKTSPGGIQSWPCLGPTTKINSDFSGWSNRIFVPENFQNGRKNTATVENCQLTFSVLPCLSPRRELKIHE